MLMIIFRQLTFIIYTRAQNFARNFESLGINLEKIFLII